MSYFQDYDSVQSPSENLTAWFWPTMVVAVLFHCAGLFWFGQTPFQMSAMDSSELAALEKMPPPVRIEQVQIDPALFSGEVLEGNQEPASKPVPDVTKIDIPADKQAFEKELQEVRASPAAPEMDPNLIDDKPRELASSLSDSIAKIETRTQRLLEEDLSSMSEKLIKDKPTIKSRPLPDLPGFATAKADRVGLPSNLKAETSGESAGPRVGQPGFSDLDELLSRTGPMSRPMAQIMMPADLLFGYNQFELSPAAVPSLEKLGTIIRRNPAATISVEGHSDSFGPSEYNQALSEKRALAVKIWLVTYMNIEPSRISIYGYGNRKLLYPPTGSIDEQQINRRVEIVIRQKR